MIDRTAKTKASLTLLVLMALLLALGGGGKGCSFPLTQKATAATYVYEKDTTSIPPPVSAALNTLNRRGIIATHHEVDTKDATNEIPEQYKAVVPAAIAAGLPSLVVSAGQRVLRVVKDPKTEEDVLKAVP